MMPGKLKERSKKGGVPMLMPSFTCVMSRAQKLMAKGRTYFHGQIKTVRGS